MAAERRFVLDTSAILALRGDEIGADRVDTLLGQAAPHQCRIFVSFMTRMELLYCIRRNDGDDAACEAMRLLDSLNMEWISCESEILMKAAEIKAEGRLSVAGSWIGATAVLHDAVLVHKNPEFKPFKKIAQEMLE